MAGIIRDIGPPQFGKHRYACPAMHNGFRCEDRSVPASDAAGKLDIRLRVPGRGAALPVGKAQRQAEHSGRWPLSPNLRQNIRIATAQDQKLPSASLLVIA
jgi:hypothetical protein